MRVTYQLCFQMRNSSVLVLATPFLEHFQHFRRVLLSVQAVQSIPFLEEECTLLFLLLILIVDIADESEGLYILLGLQE